MKFVISCHLMRLIANLCRCKRFHLDDIIFHTLAGETVVFNLRRIVWNVIFLHAKRIMACEAESTSALTATTHSPAAVPTSLIMTVGSSPKATPVSQTSSTQSYNSTSNSPLATQTPGDQASLSIRSWIGVCAGVSLGLLLIACAAVIVALHARGRKEEAKRREKAHGYPLNRILDERRVHTALELSSYRGLDL